MGEAEAICSDWKETVKLLLLVGQNSEAPSMRRLLASAGVKAEVFCAFPSIDHKPSMKKIRECKIWLDGAEAAGYTHILAAGETAARLALDTSSVNINKLRGRDFEYVTGIRKTGKKAKAKSDNNGGSDV